MVHLGKVILLIYQDINVREGQMKFYKYVIPRDFGFAPNPYHGYCTLATCKPRIRSSANIGDWIAGYGASNSKIKKKLIILMKVSEIISFDEYWTDERFQIKKPLFNRSITFMYGDNIYHQNDGKWCQEASHHSNEDGSINYENLNRDTSINRVLISEEFFYFGSNAIDIPQKFNELIGFGRNHRINENEILIHQFINFVQSENINGIHGLPYNRKEGAFGHYKGH